MLASAENLHDFNAFVQTQLQTPSKHSMQDLFQAWLELRERNEVVADMQASGEDIAAGRVTPVDEAFDEVRQKLGIRQ